MAKREYIVEFDFTSSKADGNNYTRRLTVKADSVSEAETIARLSAFSAFGAAFTDNCVDWRAVQ